MVDMDAAYLERIEAGFAKLEAAIKVLDDRQRAAENREAGNTPIMSSRLDAAWRKIDDHESDIKELRHEVAKLTQSVNQLLSVLRWMLGILSAVTTAILIALATGHLSIGIMP
jgi:predicted phage-related endonuclease